MNDQLLSLKIVCFGDSLTLGYQSPTPRFPFVENIPYGTYLQEWVGTRGQVLVRAVCGETTQDMRGRLQRDMLEQRPHVAIILGGTNDLSLGISPAAIMENLTFLYEQAQAHGILPVAVTVPSLREDCWQNKEAEGEASGSGMALAIEQAIAQRVVLNQLLQDFGVERQFPVVDWFVETCEPKTQALASEYSNDGLHLTTAGYRKLAEMIWTQVLEDRLKKLD
jgi:lysophospholipase L1-like esterase